MVEDPDLWSDSEKAQTIMQERTRLDNQIKEINDIDVSLKDTLEFIELAELEDDLAMVKESEAVLNNLKKKTDSLQIKSLLSGEADENDAFLEVNAGAGGTESCDWASMLLRMYTRWAEHHGCKVTLIDKTDGEEAGIKSVTIRIDGDKAYGWLKTENGVHRLVRISPFDSNARRHTSFASVSVSPVLDDTIDIALDEKDIKLDTYRSSGAGGQHVNTTDSAVRLTHGPSGIVVACQSERSQHQNRAIAMDMLKAKLYEAELLKREEEKAAAHGEKTDIGWGHQIRSYVLQPYQMIKDLRTGTESSNTQAVLDGDLDLFLESSLAHGIHQDK